MPRLTAEELRDATAAVFRAAGAQDEDAATVAAALVDAELSDHPSHGLIRVVEYLRHIREGAIVPEAQPEIVEDRGAALVVDGNWGFGQVVATRATEWLIERTREHGSGAVAIRRCAHVGRAGAYPELAAEQGLVALAFVSGGGMQPRLAPYGGRRPVFGTNPLAAAVPLPGSPPVVIDFSTAAVASGKIRVLRDRGEALPEGWIQDAEGRPSTSAADYYDGGMLLPAAAHKGYGLCLLVELLAACVTGAGSVGVPDSGYRLGNGMFLQAFESVRSCRSRSSPRAPARSPTRCGPPRRRRGTTRCCSPVTPSGRPPAGGVRTASTSQRQRGRPSSRRLPGSALPCSVGCDVVGAPLTARVGRGRGRKPVPGLRRSAGASTSRHDSSAIA